MMKESETDRKMGEEQAERYQKERKGCKHQWSGSAGT